MTKEEFIVELSKLNIHLSQEKIEQYEKYCKYLLEYNTHTNLTAIRTEEEVYLKHFYDSILLSQTINFDKINNMLDIGCGAGFPGIVIKILYPHIKLTLLDSNNKKTTFCQKIIELLTLKDVEIIQKRAEEYIENKRESYDLVTARAVKNLPVLNELAIPFVKINGLFIAMKSEIEEELNKSKNGIKILGGEYINTININLPNNEGVRNFVLIKKINKTNIQYPRQYNKIIKNPL